MVQDAPALACLALVKCFSPRERLDHFVASEFRDAVLISVITHNLQISYRDRTNVCAARSSMCWGAGFSWFDPEGTMTIRINGSTAVWAPTGSLFGFESVVVQGKYLLVK